MTLVASLLGSAGMRAGTSAGIVHVRVSTSNKRAAHEPHMSSPGADVNAEQPDPIYQDELWLGRTDVRYAARAGGVSDAYCASYLPFTSLSSPASVSVS